MLTSLSQRPRQRKQLITALASFDSSVVVEEVIGRVVSHDWIEESGDVVLLTDAGARQRDALAPLVDLVRQHVTAALPAQEYTALVDLLARLVNGLHAAT